MKIARFAAALLIPLAVVSCKKDGEVERLTAGEAAQALEEAAISGEAGNVAAGSIEITTNFTIGSAVEQAAAELRSFVASQLPCAEISLIGGTLKVTYGAKPGSCTYRGQTYKGTHTVTVTRNDESEVLVQHTWDELSNGRVSVSGTADVTWSAKSKSRHVVHELTWTRLADGRTGVGTGDNTQTVLEGGLAEGIRLDGSHTWEGTAGRWDLAVEGVEMRWTDPVPQAGTYRLATPRKKSLSLSFDRVDDDTIKVTVRSGDRSFDFDVTKAGATAS